MTARGYPVLEFTYLCDDGVMRKWALSDPGVTHIGLYYGTFYVTLQEPDGPEITLEVPEINAVSAVLMPSGDC